MMHADSPLLPAGVPESLRADIVQASASAGLCVQLLREAGHKVSAGGAMRCIFPSRHRNGDRNASARAYGDGYKCHGCDAALSVFEVWAHVHNLNAATDYQRIAVDLCNRLGIDAGARADSLPRRPIRRVKVAAPYTPSPVAPLPVPSQPVREHMRALWAYLKASPLTDELGAWCESRGLSPVHAYASGVRDSAFALADDCPPAARLRAWHWTRGALIPCADPSGDVLGYRLRRFDAGDGPKELATKSPPAWSRLPIASPAMIGSEHLVICEGGPDWLTLRERLRTSFPHADVIGLSGSHWRAEWSAYLQGRRLAVLAMHADEDDKGKLQVPKSAPAVASACNALGVRLRTAFVSGGRDWNDLLCAGDDGAFDRLHAACVPALR